MPKEVIFNQSIIYIDQNPKRLLKTSINRELNHTIQFEGGIGRFLDLLIQNDVLIARTTKGWFYSTDEGINWRNEIEWEIYDPSTLQHIDSNYLYMSQLVKDLIIKKPDLVSHKDPTLHDWLSEWTYGQFEILEVAHQQEMDLFHSEFLSLMVDEKFEKLLYLFPEYGQENLSKEIYDLQSKGKLLRKSNLIKNIINESIFMSDFGISNLYHFFRVIKILKIQHDIKIVLISDLFMFFKSDHSVEFVESTLHLMCEICDQMNIRIIAVMNLTLMDKTRDFNYIRSFRHPFCERFTVVYESGIDQSSIHYKDEF
jgi:hypothetical protein